MENKKILLELAILSLLAVSIPLLFSGLIYPALGLAENTPMPIRTLILGFLILVFMKRNQESFADVGIRKIEKIWLFILLVPGLLFLQIVIPSLAQFIVPTGPVDYSFFDYIQGNTQALIFWIAMSWVFGGFFEELIFRGYLIRRVNVLLGEGSGSMVVAVIVQAVVFGLFHSYQGVGGVIATFLVGLVTGLVYARFKNLWITIGAHGLLDTLGFITIYLNGTTNL